MAVKDDTFIHEVLGGAVGRSIGFFNVDDGFIVSQDPEWSRGALI